MKQVKIFGPGCKRCEAAAQMVKDAAARLSVEVEIEKVTDPRSMAMAGVMSTPGISVDGTLVHSGGLPDAASVETWLSA